MKEKFIDYYMGIAELTAKLSTATRLKVGTVVVRDNKILASGYNGTPSGWNNICEEKKYVSNGMGAFLEEDGTSYDLVTKREVLHSEANALTKIARSTETSEGATLFCTHSPCLECAKLIYQSGINSVFYRENYRETTGIDFLKKSGVNVQQYARD